MDELAWVLTDLRIVGIDVVLVKWRIGVGAAKKCLWQNVPSHREKQGAAAVGQAMLMVDLSQFF